MAQPQQIRCRLQFSAAVSCCLLLLPLPVSPTSFGADAPSVVEMLPLPSGPSVLTILACDQLPKLDFDQTQAPARVLSASIELAQGERAQFCLVRGYVAPTIQFELRLPTDHYSSRYLQGGCGGNCGRVPDSVSPRCDNAMAMSGAFAVGFENSGHVGGDGVWALGGEQVRIDFAYRAAHVFSLAAKTIIAACYGQPPAYSYFDGCSDGGREAMAETQRYPQDFNGLIAGSPANIISEAMERFIWEARWVTTSKALRSSTMPL